MCLSSISSILVIIVAFVALLILIKSLFLTLRMADMPFSYKILSAKSLIPFSVITKSGLSLIIPAQICLICSSSDLSALLNSDGLLNSYLVILSPFLYSNGESISNILGFVINFRIWLCINSFSIIIPSNTSDSFNSPSIFSIFISFLIFNSLF